MGLQADSSIPFPFDNPGTWETLRLTSTTSQTQAGVIDVVWPERDEYGTVEFDWGDIAPEVDDKKKVGSKKAKRTTTGTNNVKVSVKLTITDAGWGTFVALWRILALEKGSPYRLKHPMADVYGLRGFVIDKFPKPVPIDGGAECVIGFSEIDPAEQSGTGKGGAVKTPGSKTPQEEAALVEEGVYMAQVAGANFAAGNISFADYTERLKDLANKNGDPVQKRVYERLSAANSKKGL